MNNTAPIYSTILYMANAPFNVEVFDNGDSWRVVGTPEFKTDILGQEITAVDTAVLKYGGDIDPYGAILQAFQL